MGGCGSSSSTSSLFSKALFGTLVVLGFILVLLVGTLQSEENETKTTLRTETSSSTGKLQEHAKVLGRGKSLIDGHPQLDLNYMSKRRVPNGPDPIHNRCGFIYCTFSLSGQHKLYAIVCDNVVEIYYQFIRIICMVCINKYIYIYLFVF